ncbi:MAG: ABC transporter permease [Planctomycetota bacterium]
MTAPSSNQPLRRALGRLGPLLGLAAIWSLFAVLLGDSFWGWDNQRLMLLQTAIVGTAAVGATIVIISGGIDLSVGAAIARGTVVGALGLSAGLPEPIAAVGGVLACAVVGAWIGAAVTGRIAQVSGLALGAALAWSTVGPLGLPVALGLGFVVAAAAFALLPRFVGTVELSPFIVTLAMWGALRGLAKGLGDNQPVYVDGQPALLDLMRNGDSGLSAIAAPGVFVLAALAGAFAWMLRNTRFGRHVFAVGSNEQTARLCGVRVERTKMWIYALASATAGLAAILQFAYLGMGDPTTAEGYELKVIAAVVIGGASLTGGEGSILGTLVGAFIMTVVDNGCTKLGLENWVQEIVTGAIILVAVAIDRMRHRRS